MAILISFIIAILSLSLLGCGGSHYAPVRDATVGSVSDSSSLLNNVSGQAGIEHVVQPGETLYAIAWKYQRNYQDLAAINNIPEPYNIHPGQTILLQGNTDTTAAPVIADTQVATYAIPETMSPQTLPPAAELAVTTETQPQENIALTPAAAPTQTATENVATEQPKPEPETTTLAASEAPSTPVTISVAPAAGKAQWIWPTEGKVLRGFSKKNKGLDIQGKKGEPVYAIASGQVVYSGTGLRGYGQLVIIKHNVDYLSAYAHNNKILVIEGQQVNQGQQIAEIGNTGTNTTKLHFELRFKGKPVDPIKYLPPR